MVLWAVDSEASGINDAGQVVGWSDTAGGDQHAFITGSNGMGMRDLGDLGGKNSRALDINNAGQVVGGSRTASGADHAFITGPDGAGMMDLNSLVHLPNGVVLTEAWGINCRSGHCLQHLPHCTHPPNRRSLRSFLQALA